MLKLIGFIAGLFVLTTVYEAEAQNCCCDSPTLGQIPMSCNSVINPLVCEFIFSGTWNTSPCTSLPIELVYFHAQAEDGKVKLAWETAAEIDNDYFTIERSPDGINWESVDEIPGAGNSAETLVYEAWDKRPFPGLSYYRLKQTDYDGAFSYSNIVPVQVITDKPYSIFPNPAIDHVTIIFNSDTDLKIRITNQIGQEVNPEMIIENRSATINTSGMNKGFYLFYISQKDNDYIEKIILR